MYTPGANDNFVSKTVNVRAPNDNTGLIENNQKTSMLYMAINKNDLDASIFTPNKEYIINAGEVYKDCTEYTGNYILQRKRELYFKSSEETSSDKLVLSLMLFFEKVYK